MNVNIFMDMVGGQIEIRWHTENTKFIFYALMNIENLFFLHYFDLESKILIPF